MTLEEREKKIRDVFEKKLIPILTHKGHDYAGENDSLSNLRDFGWHGVVIRIGDKYHRIKNFVKQNELHVKDETIDDTLHDLVIYGFLAILMRNEIKEKER